MTKNRAMVILSIVMVALLGGGAALIVRGLHEHSAGQPIPGGVTTTGTVVSVQQYCTKGCTYQPTISYVVDGHTYQFAGVTRNGDPAVGSSDKISYDPLDPAVAHDLGGGSARYITDVVMGGVCTLISLLLGWVIATTPRRLRRRAAQAGPQVQPRHPTWDESLQDQPLRDDEPR